MYRAVLDRVAPGPWSFLLDWMKDERDLSRIADCAYMEALPRPGWSVETDLPPAAGAGGSPGGRGPVREKAQPGDCTDTFPRCLKDIAVRESGPAMISLSEVLRQKIVLRVDFKLQPIFLH